jgi:hypothetical protein
MTATDARPTARDGEPTTGATPWREIVRYALLGTLGMFAWIVVDVGGLNANVLAFVQPGNDGPSAAVMQQDFPDDEFPDGLGLDGQQYYAMARDPFHLDEVAPSLDRPEYRLRRPMYAWIAWALHPTGGGAGLAYALIGVNLLALAGGGIASGALSTALGGRTWPAFAFPLLPGSYMSLRVSVADALAIALVLGALACLARRRAGPAVGLTVMAVLTKETMLVVLAGWALAQRTKQSVIALAAGVATLGAWSLWLKAVLPDAPAEKINEIVLPLTGFPDAFDNWASGANRLGALATIGALVLAVLALARNRLRHPLSWAILANLALVTTMRWNVLALSFGGTRSTMPLAMLSLIALAAPGAVVSRGATRSPGTPVPASSGRP